MISAFLNISLSLEETWKYARSSREPDPDGPITR